MMTASSPAPLDGPPYRTAAAPVPRPFDPDGGRVPYDGQRRLRLSICAGLSRARIVIDPQARDLLAIACGPGRRPHLSLADGELTLRWQQTFSDWLCSVLTAGSVFVANLALTTELDELTIALHPAVEWTLAVRGGVSHLACELAAGSIEGIDLAGGASHLTLELPAATAAVPIRIAGGASHLTLRRPAGTGVALAVGGGLCNLRLDDRRFQAIGGAAQLETRDLAGDLADEPPHYQLAISGGACDVGVERG